MISNRERDRSSDVIEWKSVKPLIKIDSFEGFFCCVHRMDIHVFFFRDRTKRKLSASVQLFDTVISQNPIVY